MAHVLAPSTRAPRGSFASLRPPGGDGTAPARHGGPHSPKGATTEDRTMPRPAIINLKHHPELQRALEDREEFEGVVRADRRTRWGNRFVIGRHGTREEVIERYRRRLWQRIREGDVSLEALAGLHGKTLACWCHPKPCHCNVLARAAAWAVSVLAGRKAA
ncbi:MAG: DUF4326 domain-containing protein [Rhodospirillales bacterium]|nr:DUF4326 domain-containing protein [Rhodospirillales bacterium]